MAHATLLAEEKYDTRLASVRLLGRDIAHMLSQAGVDAVTAILSRETDEEKGFRMLYHMVKGSTRQSEIFEDAHRLLEKLLQGIQEGAS